MIATTAIRARPAMEFFGTIEESGRGAPVICRRSP